MKKTLTTLAITIFAVANHPLHADQAIYKTKGTATIIGRGSEQKLKADYGYWVLDPETKELTVIAALTAHGKKVIQIVETDNMNVITVRGANGKTFTSFAKGESPSKQIPTAMVECIFAIGENAPVSIDGKKIISIPKKFTSQGFGHFNFGSGHFMTNQSQGVGVLDLKASQDSNIKNQDHAAVVNKIAADLKAMGYSENPRVLQKK